MIKIFANIPKADDGTSFYRGLGPLANLRQRHLHDLHYTHSNLPNWPELREADLVFMQRPFAHNHRDTALRTKLCGRPLWVDFDDDMFSLSSDNAAYPIYNDPKISQNIKDICKMADAITVTNETLANLYSQWNKNTHIIENAYDEDMFSWRDPVKKKKMVFWRGTMIHDRAFHKYANAIIDVARHNLDWDWYFFGGAPWWLLDEMPEGVDVHWNHGEQHLLNYFNIEHSVEASIQFVLCLDRPFDRAKSNIAWIEASHSGRATLAPDWPDWRHPGCQNYGDEKEFYSQMCQMMKSSTLKDDAEKSYAFIKEHLTLTEINKKRVKIIHSLL